MLAQVRDLKGLRIEEGTHLDIPQTADPLDGTWTRPDPALFNILFINRIKVLFVFFIYLAVFSIMAIIMQNRVLMFIITSGIMIAMILLILVSYWHSRLSLDNHRFRITDEELIVESGAMTVNTTLVPLSSICEVSIVASYWHRRYGIADVQVHGNELLGLANADEVAEAILSRVKAAKSKTMGA
jgi:membrane protein YdbS with pleckstrin-like domain